MGSCILSFFFFDFYCFFFFANTRVALPIAGVITAFYESKHYARTRVGSIYGSGDIERVPGLPSTTLPLTCLLMP